MATAPDPTTTDPNATSESQLDSEPGAPPPDTAEQPQEEQVRWPGWPGDNVFRLIVPVAKVGSIIGRKGELVKKMCDETRARIRVLDGPPGIPDRVVLISAKEELEASLSPAMDAVLRVFKRVSGLSTGEGDVTGLLAAGAAFASIKLLVASPQAINLIGKQGSTIRSIQESTGAVVRVLAEEEVPSYASSEERIVELHGEAAKVLKALEAVIGQLRKFLVDHSVVPIFEKTHNAAISQERPADSRVDKVQTLLQSAPPPQTAIVPEYSLSLKRDPSLFDRETFDQKISQSGLSSHYESDPVLSGLRSTGLGLGVGSGAGVARATGAPVFMQVTQTMQVPLSYAEDIIGVGGSNIAYIRRTSGAILTIKEIRGVPDEIAVEIKGNTSEVHLAQQLIQDFLSNHKEPASSGYGKIDSGISSAMRSSAYTQLSDTGFPSSSFSSHVGGGRGYGSSSLGGYRSPGVGGYNSFKF